MNTVFAFCKHIESHIQNRIKSFSMHKVCEHIILIYYVHICDIDVCVIVCMSVEFFVF